MYGVGSSQRQRQSTFELGGRCPSSVELQLRGALNENLPGSKQVLLRVLWMRTTDTARSYGNTRMHDWGVFSDFEVVTAGKCDQCTQRLKLWHGK